MHERVHVHVCVSLFWEESFYVGVRPMELMQGVTQQLSSPSQLHRQLLQTQWEEEKKNKKDKQQRYMKIGVCYDVAVVGIKEVHNIT